MIVDLLAADLRRVVWRPLTRALCAVTVVAIVAAGTVVFARSNTRHPFDTLSGLRSAVEGATVPLTLAGFVLAASLLGADYASRALTTLLIWEPRRPRVLAARAVACAAVTGCASLAVLAMLTLALLPAALARGNGGVPTGGWYVSLATLAARAALLAAAGSVIGLSCAAITRSTTGAVVSLIVYWLIVERAVRGLWPKVGQWLLVADAQAWITAHPASSLGAPDARSAPSATVADLVLLCAVITLYALATWSLSHRDIT